MEEGENRKERTREDLEGWRKARTGRKGQEKIWSDEEGENRKERTREDLEEWRKVRS